MAEIANDLCVDCDPQQLQNIPMPANSLGLHTADNTHNSLDPSTFLPPSPLPTPNITIEFCDKVSHTFDEGFRQQYRPPDVFTVSMVSEIQQVIGSQSISSRLMQATPGYMGLY